MSIAVGRLVVGQDHLDGIPAGLRAKRILDANDKRRKVVAAALATGLYLHIGWQKNTQLATTAIARRSKELALQFRVCMHIARIRKRHVGEMVDDGEVGRFPSTSDSMNVCEGGSERLLSVYLLVDEKSLFTHPPDESGDGWCVDWRQSVRG